MFLFLFAMVNVYFLFKSWESNKILFGWLYVLKVHAFYKNYIIYNYVIYKFVYSYGKCNESALKWLIAEFLNRLTKIRAF